MIQVEVHPSHKLCSEMCIDIKKTKYISYQLKELILDNLFIVDKKHKLLSEMFYQLIKYQKVPLLPMLKEKLVIVDVSVKPQEPTVQLLDTLKMEQKPESDYHQVPEKLFLETADVPLELLPVVEEPINQC